MIDPFILRLVNEYPSAAGEMARAIAEGRLLRIYHSVDKDSMPVFRMLQHNKRVVIWVGKEWLRANLTKEEWVAYAAYRLKGLIYE